MNYQFGLIGYPIEHSLSPWIHEQFLQKSGLNGAYTIMEISPEDSFENKLIGIKNSQLNGFNVTVPYKKKIIPYLDELDEEAREIGAVNTVVNRNGKWVGYNTDGKGYIRAFNTKFPGLLSDPSIKIIVIGAGGAARGIYYALTSNGCHHVDIANRTKSSAMGIASLKKYPTNTAIVSLDEAQHSIENYDVIIQTTSVGMKPNVEDSIIQFIHLKQNCVVSDIVYQPILTSFLNEADRAGARIHLGHTMLLYQAQYAFEIWTNRHVSIGNMDDELKHILESR